MDVQKMKARPFIRKVLPFLREGRRLLWTIQNSPALWSENRRSRHWSMSYNAERAEAIESALQEVKNNGGHFEGWALSAAALRAFTQQLCEPLQGESPLEPCLVEFGSGQSTYFWGALISKGLALRVHTYEHHPYWAKRARLKTHERVNVHHQPLLQVSDTTKQEMFDNAERAYSLFTQQGTLLPESEWENTRTPNAFYRTDFEKDFTKQSIHGVILDGPNGSGRSLVFSWIQPYLAPNALILIDDYDHYPFLSDLQKMSDYEMIHVSHKLGKRWCLLRLTS